MQVSEIVTLVLKEMDMDNEHVREFLPLTHGTKYQRDLLSIIMKICDIDEHTVKESCHGVGCTVATGTNALNRFYHRIKEDLFENDFERCLKKYSQLEQIKI